MAEKGEQQAAEGLPEFSEKHKSAARQWFNKAADSRERREYDYAIECILSGLSFWPEAVEEGHMPLWSLAIQRQQAGGKKPGMLDPIKKPMNAKDPKTAMLNAEWLMARDPTNGSYLDGVLKNAARAMYYETLKWVTPLVLASLKKDAKPNAARFKHFRETLVEAAEKADSFGLPEYPAYFYEHAVQSLEFLISRNPGDQNLKDEQRDLSGKLTIVRGKYSDAETFRDSLRDADKQKLLHDAERVQQGEQTLEQIIAAARAAWEAEPASSIKINAYVDALLRRERKAEEDEAVAVLLKAYESTRNYSFKQRADDVRIRQLRRAARALEEQARRTGSDSDRQQARLATMEMIETEIEVHQERVQKYPTDLRAKFRLGESLFRAGRYDEAIPMLQLGQGDPRSRARCQLLIGRAFLEKQVPSQAVEVLREAIDGYELSNDDMAKELNYWLARAFEADGKRDEAKAAFGKLLRLDYNYRGGDARTRLEALSAAGG